MGGNAICTKQTNEDGGENRKAKPTSKGLFNSACTLATSAGVERELKIYIYIYIYIK